MTEFLTEGNIEYYYNITQGSDEWLRLKHGVLSTSTFKNVITAKTLKLSTAKTTTLFYDDILSQRIDDTIEPNFESWDMRRGHIDEPYAVQQYAREYKRNTQSCGFIINNKLGFPIGFSPDSLVDDDGFVEVKSKNPKHQIKTIMDHICERSEDLIPNEHMMQVQAGLFVTERKWCDFVSFCNGNQMATIRVEPIPKFQEAIEEAAVRFEGIIQENMRLYQEAIENDPRLTLSERHEYETEMMI